MKKRPIQPELNFWEKEESGESSVCVQQVREEANVLDDGVRRIVHQDVRNLPSKTFALYLPSLVLGLRREREEHQEQVIRDSIAIHQEYNWFGDDADEGWIEFWCERITLHRTVVAEITEQLERMKERMK